MAEIVRAPFRRRSVWSRDTVISGAAAGATGGVLMLLFWLGQAQLAGAGFAHPLRLIASAFRDAPVAGAGAVALGLALHLALATALGIGFAAMTERRASVEALPVTALFFAVAVLLFGTFAVLPLTNVPLLASVLRAPGAWLLMHALYAAGLTAMPLYRRWLHAREPGGAVVIPLRRAAM